MKKEFYMDIIDECLTKIKFECTPNEWWAINEALLKFVENTDNDAHDISTAINILILEPLLIPTIAPKPLNPIQKYLRESFARDASHYIIKNATGRILSEERDKNIDISELCRRMGL